MSMTEDTDVLATLDEQQKTAVEIDKIRRMTVEPGYMWLPVSQIANAKNSPQVAIDVDHPFEGEQRFFLNKPMTWEQDNELVRFLDWYDTSISGMYELQTGRVYVAYNADVDDWELSPPPDYEPPVREKLEKKWDRVKASVPSVRLGSLTALSIWLSMVTVAGAVATKLGMYYPSGGLAFPISVGILSTLFVSGALTMSFVMSCLEVDHV